MDEILKTLDLKYIITTLVLPVVTWILRGVYESWKLRGIYLSAIPGTGEAPGLIFDENGNISAVKFGIDVRVLNLTDKLHAIERVKICWDRVKSKHLTDLRWLEDNDPIVSPLHNIDGTQDDIVIFPVVIPADGGSVRLHLDTRMVLLRRKSFRLRKERYFPKYESSRVSEEEFFWGLRRGTGKITMRIDGKVRSLPVCIWRDK